MIIPQIIAAGQARALSRRKKGSLGKQLSKLFPFACGLIAILLTVGVIYQHSNLKHWKAEHAKVQGQYTTRGEDAKRLQVCPSCSRDWAALLSCPKLCSSSAQSPLNCLMMTMKGSFLVLNQSYILARGFYEPCFC